MCALHTARPSTPYYLLRTYMSIIVHLVIRQLQLIKRNNLLHPLGPSGWTVGVHMYPWGRNRICLSRYHPTGTINTDFISQILSEKRPNLTCERRTDTSCRPKGRSPSSACTRNGGPDRRVWPGKWGTSFSLLWWLSFRCPMHGIRPRGVSFLGGLLRCLVREIMKIYWKRNIIFSSEGFCDSLC